MNGFSDKVNLIWTVADLLRGDFKQSICGGSIEPANRQQVAPRSGMPPVLATYEPDLHNAHGAAVIVMRNEILSHIARGLIEATSSSVTIDWTQTESLHARMRYRVKRLHWKHGSPPGQQAAAVTAVIEHDDQVCREWAVA